MNPSAVIYRQGQEVCMDAKTKDLNLLLIYLSGWESEDRKEAGKKVYRAWKGYLFDILDELEREDMIRQYRSTVELTPRGKSRAMQLRRRFL